MKPKALAAVFFLPLIASAVVGQWLPEASDSEPVAVQSPAPTGRYIASHLVTEKSANASAPRAVSAGEKSHGIKSRLIKLARQLRAS